MLWISNMLLPLPGADVRRAQEAKSTGKGILNKKNDKN
jgi:hypothetical protein